MIPSNDDIAENKRLFREMGEKVNDFTTLFNKYNLDYEVKLWDDGEGFDIKVGQIIIEINEDGRISFHPNEALKQKFEEAGE